jgi:hypothetical protein
MQRLAPCRKAVRALAARYPRSHRPKRISTDALWARRHVGCSSRDGHTMRPQPPSGWPRRVPSQAAGHPRSQTIGRGCMRVLSHRQRTLRTLASLTAALSAHAPRPSPDGILVRR